MEQAFLQAPDNNIIAYVQSIITSSLHFNTNVPTVIPAVIVLKMIINAMKQIIAHKVRICTHGGHQE
jgi:hypothetical protein